MDYLGGTVCPQTYELQSKVWTNERSKPLSAVFVVHGIEWNSMFYMPMLSPYMSTQRCRKAYWMYPLFPICALVAILGRFLLRTAFTVQRWTYIDSTFATWSIPRLGYSYLWPREHLSINKLLLQAAQQADAEGATHMGLGALNKAVFLNTSGKDLVPMLHKGCRLKLVTGNTLTAAVVYDMIRQRVHPSEDVFFTGATSKVGTPVVLRLLHDGYRIKIWTRSQQRFDKLRELAGDKGGGLTKADRYEDGASCSTWVLGSALTQRVVKLVQQGTTFLQFAVPPTQDRFISPLTVTQIGNVNFDRSVCDLTVCCNCEQGEVPACLAATVIHSLEGFTEHEVGDVDASQMDRWLQLATSYGMVGELARKDATRREFEGDVCRDLEV